MKKIVFLMHLLYTLVLTGQYCSNDTRFTQTPVFTGSQLQADYAIPYGSALDWHGHEQTLTLNIFYPSFLHDSYSKRPLILLFFGGGYISGNKEQMNAYCIEFAKRGYVAATADYRLGKETVIPCTDILSQEKAVYRATQDGCAAMRYLVHNAAQYRIDTAWLFTGGYSAGAGIANAMQYFSQEEIDRSYPTFSGSLGQLHRSGNTLTDTYSINGIFNNWGGISSDFFDASEAVPMIAFHGSNDGVVPLDSAIDVTCTTTDHYLYGSHTLYTKLTSAGICSDLSIKPGAGHGVYQSADGKTFRIERACCFFKSIFCGQCRTLITTDSIPADCEGLTTDIQEYDSDSDYFLHPNPVDEKLHIQFPENRDVQINVYNSEGRIMHTGYSPELDCANFPTGLYTVLLQTEDVMIQRRLMKK